MDIYGKYRSANRLTFQRREFCDKMGRTDLLGIRNTVFHGGGTLHIAFHKQFDIFNGGIFLLNQGILFIDRKTNIRTGREVLVHTVQIDIKYIIGHFHRCRNIYYINRQCRFRIIAAPFTLDAYLCFADLFSADDAVFINRHRISHRGICILGIRIFLCVVVQNRVQAV